MCSWHSLANWPKTAPSSTNPGTATANPAGMMPHGFPMAAGLPGLMATAPGGMMPPAASPMMDLPDDGKVKNMTYEHKCAGLRVMLTLLEPQVRQEVDQFVTGLGSAHAASARVPAAPRTAWASGTRQRSRQ